MDFTELVKHEAKQRANYCCVFCQRVVFLEVHHIIPPKDGGSADIENAAPLCPSHHTLYGDNPSMRKFVREARDFWWAHCAQQAANAATMAILERFDRLQTDVSEGRRELGEVKNFIVNQLRGAANAVSSATSVKEIVQATTNAVAVTPGMAGLTLTGFAPTVTVTGPSTQSKKP